VTEPETARTKCRAAYRPAPLHARYAETMGKGNHPQQPNGAGLTRDPERPTPAGRPASPFLRYQGIGNPGIPSGRRHVIAWVRRLRRP
jgi:hypothetical protein